jgi:hypothetical protein
MTYSKRVQVEVVHEMNIVFERCTRGSAEMCNAADYAKDDTCDRCPWSVFAALGCLDVAEMFEDERVIACGFMAAIATLGTNH